MVYSDLTWRHGLYSSENQLNSFIMQWLLLAACGLTGIALRFGIDRWTLGIHAFFPMGTFAINLLGSFLAGVVYVGSFERMVIPSALRIPIMVGLLGGFTTFSAFSLQAARLGEQGFLRAMLLYAGLSPLLGILSAWGGLTLARIFLR